LHPEIEEIIKKMPGTLRADEARGLEAVLQFRLTGEKDGIFHAMIRDGKCQAAEGEHGQPTTTITADGADLLSIVAGEMDGATLFMSGRLKVEGDMRIALRIRRLFQGAARPAVE